MQDHLLSSAAFLEYLELCRFDWHFRDWHHYQGARCSCETVTCVYVPPGEKIRVLGWEADCKPSFTGLC